VRITAGASRALHQPELEQYVLRDSAPAGRFAERAPFLGCPPEAETLAHLGGDAPALEVLAGEAPHLAVEKALAEPLGREGVRLVIQRVGVLLGPCPLLLGNFDPHPLR